MPRPMKMEKSKDFKGSLIRLIKDLKPWRTTMIMALMLALTSAIIALVTPNKLSELTDLITDGIKPNTDVLQEIVTDIDLNSQDFIADGFLDSFALMSLIGALEQSYHISIFDEEIEIQDYVNLESIKNLLSKKGVKF